MGFLGFGVLGVMISNASLNATHLQYVCPLERLQCFSHVSKLKMTETFGVTKLPIVKTHLLSLVVHVDR